MNELKFLKNNQVQLSKRTHADKVCEAFFASDKTWYAALVIDVFEDKQEVEVAWIGYQSQEVLPKKYVNVLSPPDPNDLFEEAQCNAVYASDGMWYPCVIEKVINDEKESKDVSPEVSSIL